MRVRDRLRRFPSHDTDLLATPACGQRPSAADLRRRPRRGHRDRCDRRETAAGTGLTVLDDAVTRQDTVTQLIAAIRRVGRDVVGARDLITTHCTRLAALTGQDYTAAGKPTIAWDDPAARDELVTALVNDALALLAALDVETIEKAGGRQADAVALLALVAGQDVEPNEDSDGTAGRGGSRKTAPDRMISTVDPNARHAHKTRERRQDGFKAHVVVEPDTGLTTAV